MANHEQDAEISQSLTGGTEIGAIEGARFPNCQTSLRRTRSSLGDIVERIAGALGSAIGSEAIWGLTGGILARLIEDQRDRIREADECIVWYDRVKEEAEEKLQELLGLLERFEVDQSGEGESEL